MNRIHAAITAVGGYVPDKIVTNDDIAQMVDTSDEWIMTRVGIKERRKLEDPQLGSSYMAIQAVKDMLERHSIDPKEIEAIVLSTNSPDYPIPNTSSRVALETGCTNAFAFDICAACPGFLYGLEIASGFIMSGRYKKVLVVCTEKMSAIIDPQDRATAPLFGDGAGCALIEPCTPEYGLQDSIIRTDGTGLPHLTIKAGGSVQRPTTDTVENREHYVFQDGQTVFKAAVSSMGDTTLELMERNNLSADDIKWVVPHQANMRIIDAVARRMGFSKEQLEEKVMINIHKFGNTSSATIPICLWEWEKDLKKGDKLVLTAFGAGFTWGSSYIVWAYDYDKK